MSRLCGCWKCFKCDADLLFGGFILQCILMTLSERSASVDVNTCVNVSFFRTLLFYILTFAGVHVVWPSCSPYSIIRWIWERKGGRTAFECVSQIFPGWVRNMYSMTQKRSVMYLLSTMLQTFGVIWPRHLVLSQSQNMPVYVSHVLCVGPSQKCNSFNTEQWDRCQMLLINQSKHGSRSSSQDIWTT